MIRQFTQFTLKKIDAPTFVMSPVELKDYVPFKIKRIYFMTKPTGITSEHCHKIEEEFFIMVQGTCTAIIDAGKGKEDIPMQWPTSALYVPNFVWHGFKDFSHDAVLLALSSTNYSADRSDYVTDYQSYLPLRDQHLSS